MFSWYDSFDVALDICMHVCLCVFISAKSENKKTKTWVNEKDTDTSFSEASHTFKVQ